MNGSSNHYLISLRREPPDAPRLPYGLLDHRFAWRWLLPWEPEQRICVAGFDEIERRFLHADLARVAVVEDPRQADGWVIDADHASAESVCNRGCGIGKNIRWVALVGSGRSLRRHRRLLCGAFRFISEYALLPPGNPRVVAPLRNSQDALISLDLHRPGRWLARQALRLAGALARVGLVFPLRRRVLVIATREGRLWPRGAVCADLPTYPGGEDRDYALYLGTPGANQKTTALLLGSSTPDTLIKAGSSPAARRALRNEGAALTFLRKTALRAQVPELRRLVDNEHGLALYQEYRSRQRIRRQAMERSVVDFLAGLSTLNRSSRALADLLDDMAVDGSVRCDVPEDERFRRHVRHWLQRRADWGASVWVHRSHGDFAPWNCSWTDQGLFVFDWERSSPRTLAFGDAFYYAVAPALHVARKPDPATTLTGALTLAERVANRCGLKTADVKLHFAVWLAQNWEQHPLYRAMMKRFERDL